LFLCSGDISLETLIDELDFKVQVLSIFSGLSKERLVNFSAIEIHEPFAHMMTILNYEQNDPKGFVEVDGVRYVFDMTFEKKTTGQIIDLKLIDNVYEKPLEVMAILYVEEGMIYSQVDENDIVLNPTRDRLKIFRDTFPGDEFLNVFGFFLSSYQSQNLAIFALNTARTMETMKMTKKQLEKQIEKIRNGTSGRQTLQH
jgi:hypothetical protein